MRPTSRTARRTTTTREPTGVSGDGRTEQGQARELRIGDAERTAAADELAEHYAQGRLSDRGAPRAPRPDLGGQDAAPSWRRSSPTCRAAPTSAAARRTPRPTVPASARTGRAAAQRPFPAPPFGRPPFGRPPYAGDRPVRGVVRAAAGAGQGRCWRSLLAVLVIAHLPLILLGLVIWLVLAHKHRALARATSSGSRLTARRRACHTPRGGGPTGGRVSSVTRRWSPYSEVPHE